MHDAVFNFCCNKAPAKSRSERLARGKSSKMDFLRGGLHAVAQIAERRNLISPENAGVNRQAAANGGQCLRKLNENPIEKRPGCRNLIGREQGVQIKLNLPTERTHLKERESSGSDGDLGNLNADDSNKSLDAFCACVEWKSLILHADSRYLVGDRGILSERWSGIFPSPKETPQNKRKKHYSRGVVVKRVAISWPHFVKQIGGAVAEWDYIAIRI